MRLRRLSTKNRETPISNEVVEADELNHGYATAKRESINWDMINNSLARDGPQAAWDILVREVDEELLFHETGRKISSRTDVVRYLRLKAVILHQLERHHEALDAVKQLLTITPDDGKAWQLALMLAMEVKDEAIVSKAATRLQELGLLVSLSSFSTSTSSNKGNSPIDHRPRLMSGLQYRASSKIDPTTSSSRTSSSSISSSDGMTRRRLRLAPSVKIFLKALQEPSTSLSKFFEVTWKALTEGTRETIPLVPLKELKEPRVVQILTELGFKGLYPYQHEAMTSILRDDCPDVMICAPTGAGKTEAALIPVIMRLLKSQDRDDNQSSDAHEKKTNGMPNEASPIMNSKKKAKRSSSRSSVRALFMYPTKALSRDQLLKIFRLTEPLGLTVTVLDGDTDFNTRSQIFKNPPDILISNVDMMHHHLIKTPRFSKLFSSLEFIMVDELHLYGGLKGGMLHYVIWRLRRLTRTSLKLGSLQVIAMSATVANPQEFFQQLVASRHEKINGSCDQNRHRHDEDHHPILLISATKETAPHPHQACLVLSVRNSLEWYHGLVELITIAVETNVKTLVFMESRVEVERLHGMVQLTLSTPKSHRVGMHRAGLKPEERHRIERRFKLPSTHPEALTCLVTTSTLEVGIDVGDVDVVITTPHDPEHLWQRIGRAGRKGQLALALIVLPPSDPMTTVVKRDPRILFRQMTPLRPFVDDEHLALIHLVAATRDAPVSTEEVQRLSQWKRVLSQAVKEGYVMRDLEGHYHVTKRGRSFLRHVEFPHSPDRMIVYRVDFLSEKEKALLRRHGKKSPQGASSGQHGTRSDNVYGSPSEASPASILNGFKDARDAGSSSAVNVREILRNVFNSDNELSVLTERELPRALHEFFPGANYLHLGEPHEILLVVKRPWNVLLTRSKNKTKPYIALAVPLEERSMITRVETIPFIVKQLQLIEFLENEKTLAALDGLGLKITPVRVRLTTMVVGVKGVSSTISWLATSHASNEAREKESPFMPSHVNSEFDSNEDNLASFPEFSIDDGTVRWELDPPLTHVETVEGIFIQFPRPSMTTIMGHVLMHSRQHHSSSRMLVDHRNLIFNYLTMGFHALTHLLRYAMRIHLGLKDEDVTLMYVGGSNALFIHSHVSRGILEAIVEELSSILILAREIASSCGCTRLKQQSFSGCPRCTHFRACTVRNDFLHKDLAVDILRLVLDEDPSVTRTTITSLDTESLTGKLYT